LIKHRRKTDTIDAIGTFFAGIAGLLLVVVFGAAVVGYVMNIIDLFQMATSDSEATNTAMLVIRGLGIIFAPLGAVAGYF
jgi:hypothetical protein